MVKILVVDDSAEERAMIASMLESCGLYEVEPMRSAEAALRRLEQGPVDLIVTDFVIPGVDGLELANRAIKLYPELKGRVLVVTGGMYGREDALAYAMKTIVIAKPFTLEQLLKTVEEMLAGKIAQGA